MPGALYPSSLVTTMVSGFCDDAAPADPAPTAPMPQMAPTIPTSVAAETAANRLTFTTPLSSSGFLPPAPAL